MTFAVAALGAVTAAVVVIVAPMSSAGRSAGSGIASGALTIGRGTIGAPIPAGFVGLSMEYRGFVAYAGHNPAAVDPAFVQLLRDISPKRPVLRIGGDSTDWTWWPVPGVARPPGVKLDLTPALLRVAHKLATSLDARLILGVNLEAGSSQIAAAEAHAFDSIVGRGQVAALEIGNEPELYGSFGWYRSAAGLQVPGRPHGYGLPQFTQDFTNLSRAIPGVPLAGPSSGSVHWLPQLGPFLGAEPRIRVATVHAYPLKHCVRSNIVTLAQMLSDRASTGLAQSMAPLVIAARHHRVPLRVDEMNAVSCGGTRGVSNSFASALWALDTLFEMAKVGVSGVNMHTVPNTINEIIGPVGTGSSAAMRVHPEFYGMVMFAQAAPAGSVLLRVGSEPLPGVKLWATRAPDGRIRVVVINKRTRLPALVTLRIPAATGSASVEQLMAPSAGAQAGAELGGQSFGTQTATGLLAGTAANATLAPVAGGVYTVRVPAASATMLTLTAA